MTNHKHPSQYTDDELLRMLRTEKTKTRETRERVIKEVPAGGMLVNHLAFQVSTAKLPFGGVGASGMGAYHGKFGFEEFSHRKSVLSKPTPPDLPSFIYPPYTERASKMEAGCSDTVLNLIFHNREEADARSAGSHHRRHRSRWGIGT